MAGQGSGTHATWTQSTRVWGFCTKRGNKNADWAGLARSGKLTKYRADQILRAIGKNDIAQGVQYIRVFIPDFEVDGKQQAPQEIPQETKTVPTDTAQKVLEGCNGKMKIEKMLSLTPKTKGYIKPDIFDEVGTLIKQGLQVFIVGPAGCGKSWMNEEIAKCFDWDFFTMSMSGGMRYAQVFGSTHLDGSKTVWAPSEFLMAVQKQGMVFIDEILSADPEVCLGLNALLEKNTRQIQTPIGVIKMHEDCHLVASANIAGRQVNRQYTGAQRQDDSLLDRFVCVKMEYDDMVEAKICQESGLAKDVATYFINSMKSLREAVKLNNIPFDASTRRLISAIEAFKSGVSKTRAFDVAFLTSLSEAERARISQHSKGGSRVSGPSAPGSSEPSEDW